MKNRMMLLLALAAACAVVGCAAEGTDADSASLGTSQQALRGIEPDDIDYSGDDDRGEERRESGEKGGTEDINIGIGELQEARRR